MSYPIQPPNNPPLQNGGQNFSPKKNGYTKHTMASLLSYAVIGSFCLLAVVVVGSFLYPTILPISAITDHIFMVIVMVISAFLALAKDIFNPRREITIEELMALAKFMSESQTTNAPTNQLDNRNSNMPPQYKGMR